MREAPDGRRIFVWHGPQDAERLTAAVAEAAVLELFNLDDGLIWLNEKGQPIPANNKDVLREVVTRHIVSVRLVQRGSNWEVEFFSFDFPNVPSTTKGPNEQVLIDLIPALLKRVAKGPREPSQFTPQREQEIRARLKLGEPLEVIASYYGVTGDEIRELAGR